MTKKLTVVTDIPTPYRIHLFNELDETLRDHGIGLEVFFMARTVPIRFWEFDEASCRFAFNIVGGIHPRLGSHFLHFNPGIVWSVLRTRPTYLLLGGAWNMPTIALLLFGAGLRGAHVHKILWAEANHDSTVHKLGWISRIRCTIVRRASVYAVPGKIAEDTIRRHWRVSKDSFVRLPNLVNEASFKDKVYRLRQRRSELRRSRNIDEADLVLLWPARLHERTKGILNFLGAVHELLSTRVRILVAGEGPDRVAIENWIVGNSLGQISLLGQQSEEEMLELLAIADVLLLPSLRDPNPLSVIEALWSGLPLFISASCGNWPEALDEGHNGWLVDATSKLSMKTCFADLLAKPVDELRAYGHRSLKIAEEKFRSRICVQRFVQDLLRLDSDKRVELASTKTAR